MEKDKPHVTGVRADGYASLIVRLSDGTEMIAIAAGGGSNQQNAQNRDRLVDALQLTLTKQDGA